MIAWEPVSMDRFFEFVNPKDVHPYPTGKWPYTSLWKTRGGQVVAKSVDIVPEGGVHPITHYYILHTYPVDTPAGST